MSNQVESDSCQVKLSHIHTHIEWSYVRFTLSWVELVSFLTESSRATLGRIGSTHFGLSWIIFTSERV